MRTIYVDDGHGMETAGKRTPVIPAGHELDGQQIRENRFNAAVAERLGFLGERQGWRVVMTAPEETDTPLSVRTARANADMAAMRIQMEDAVFISIHYNAYDGKWDTTKGGIEVYHYPTSEAGKRLATCIHEALLQGTAQEDRGVKNANFHVLRETVMPAVLVEAGFMDVRAEAGRMLDPAFQDEVAREILQGVNEYMGVKPCPQCQVLWDRVDEIDLECSALRARLNKIAEIAEGE